MLQTIADDIWGQPCLAYHVQPSLEPETRDAFAEVQRTVARLRDNLLRATQTKAENP